MNKAFTNFEWKNEPSYDTPLSAENLNSMNNALDTVDDRVITLDTTKLDKGTAYTMVQDVSFDESTGIFTITKLNGSKLTIDTKLEKLFINCEFDDERQQLVITLDDGTKQMVDVSALVTQYEFKESDTIILTADSDGKVYGKLKKGSITGDYLEPNYLANAKAASDTAVASAAEAKKSEANAKEAETNAVESAATASSNATIASTSATNAKESETNAKTSETNATNAATTATEKASEAVASASAAKTSETNSKASETNANTAAKTAQSYAVGGTGTREGEDTENAKHYYEAVKKVADYVVTGGVTGVKGSEESEFRTGQVTLSPADLGLGNVNNTSDADKPVSTAQQAAIESAVAAVETSRYGNIATAGWYRVAVISTPYADGGFPLNVDLIIRRTFNQGNNETHYLRFVMCYQKYQFVSLQSKSNWQIITKIRSTYDSDAECMYLEIYYAEENENMCLFTVSNKASVLAYWQVITPTITEETIDGVTVLATYDIPANATPVTSVDLEQYPYPIRRGYTEAEIDAIYNNYSADMPNSTSYKGIVEHHIQHSVLGGGAYAIEGYKSDSNYEWQIVKTYWGNVWYRNKNNAVWSSWETFIKRKSLASTLADYLPLSGGTVNALTSSTSLTAKGGLSGNTATPTPFYTKNRTYFVNKDLNWNTNSYLEHVILLLPTLTASNQGTDNYIDGKFLLRKTGGNIFDTVEVNANCCYNILQYHLEYYGENAGTGWKLCVCTYNGVSYYALKCPYHANPYNVAEFVGHIYSELNGGTNTVALPLGVPYYNHHTSTVLNSEIYNSITDKLETTYVTAVHQHRKFFPVGIKSNVTGNADTATRLTTSAGSATKPVYFADGKPVACNYTLNTNVNASAYHDKTGIWSALGGRSTINSISTMYHGGDAMPPWGTGAYSSSLVFGALDTKGLISCSYYTPIVAFGGGSVGNSTNDAPNWNFRIIGANNQWYQLPSSSGTLASNAVATTSANGLMSAVDKTRLNRISGTHFYAETQQTGYYKININSAKSWMLCFTIRLYASYRAIDIMICGYNYGANYWYSPRAVILGDTESSRGYATTVTFGYDSAWNLWVAIPAGWYTGLDIINVTNGYTQIVSDTDSLFTVTNLASLTGTIQTTVTAYPPYHRNDTIYANTANTLATARNIQTNLGSTSAVAFNGSANVTPGVTGTLGIGNGGTGSTTVAGALSNLGTAPVVISTSAPSVTTALWAY